MALDDHLLVTDAPAFLVGVTGYLTPDPGDVSTVRQRVRLVLRFLREGGAAPSEPGGENGPTLAESLANYLTPSMSNVKQRSRLRRFYCKLLRRWTPLGDTPLILFSALAPGADSIVAAEASSMGVRVVAALPFPADQYRGSSSFVRGEDPAADQARQHDFDERLSALGPTNRFQVPLASDVDLPVDQRVALTATDLHECDDHGTPRRHLRYYAAGEYLAAHCHLLLALWDGTQEASSTGTSAVVHARLHGPRRGVLPSTSGVAMAHGGPLLHIFTRKQGKDVVEGIDDPPMRFLHPYAFAETTPFSYAVGERVAPDQHLDLSLQRERLGTFIRAAANLKAFQTLQAPAWDRGNHQSEYHRRFKRLGCPDAENQQKLVPLPEKHEFFDKKLAQGLRQLSNARRHVADATTWLTRKRDTALQQLFSLTLVAAALLHVFAHWHPAHDAPSGASAHHVPEGASAHHALEGASGSHSVSSLPENVQLHNAASHAPSTFRSLAGGAAFGLGLVALLIFAWRRSQRIAAQAEDARALAEGLRVQFYWNLAGLGQSVSANYMQRQRTELDWIRAVIRSFSQPYHWWADQFRQLTPELQSMALQCVEGGWIRDQLTYFQGAYRKRNHALHGWHTLGFAASLAGVLSILAWYAASLSDRFKGWLEGHAPKLLWVAVGLVLLAALWRLILGLFQAYQARSERNLRGGSAGHHTYHHGLTWSEVLTSARSFPRRKKVKEDAGPPGAPPIEPLRTYVGRLVEHCADAFAGLLIKAVDTLVPSVTPASHAGAESLGWLLLRHAYNLIALLPVSLAAAALALFATITLPQCFDHWPAAENLGIIAGGILLLCGAMSVAWTEKNLDSELAYQYNSMAALFRHTARRIRGLLRQLEQQLAAINDQATGPEERNSAHVEFNWLIKEVQALLYDLGVEALDENAEWLFLHRARPLEPVMAG